MVVEGRVLVRWYIDEHIIRVGYWYTEVYNHAVQMLSRRPRKIVCLEEDRDRQQYRKDIDIIVGSWLP